MKAAEEKKAEKDRAALAAQKKKALETKNANIES